MKNAADQRARRGWARASILRGSWPEGATAGILIVAAACLAVSLTLYHVAGPRDLVAEEAK